MKAWLRMLRGLAGDLHQLRPHLRPNRWLVAAVMAASTLSALFEGIGIGLLVPMIWMLQTPSAELVKKLGDGKYLHWLPDLFPGRPAGFYVAVFCGVVLVAVIAKNLVLLLSLMLSAKFSRRIAANLREAIFHRMQHTAIHIFEERKAGELGNLFSIETIRTQNAVEYLLLLVQRCLLAVCYLGAMVWLSWELSLGLLLMALVVGGLSLLVQVRLKHRGDDRSVAQRDLFGYLAGVFSGIRVVRATNAQNIAEAEFDRLNQRMAEVERRAAALGGLMAPLTESSALAGATS